MQHPKELNIGDIVYHKYYGIGQIEDIDKDLGEPFQYLVYYYKEKKKTFHYTMEMVAQITTIGGAMLKT